MASSSIALWQTEGKTMKTVKSFLFLGSKITVDGDCSHEMKRRLLLGRKVMTNLGSIFKSRDTILSTKICRVKPMVFPVVMCRCESWTIKKGEHQRIDAFKLWCWKILLRVPWTGGRNKSVNYKENQPWIFIGRIDTEAEARIVCPPDVKSQLIGKDLDDGTDWGQEKGATEDETVGWYHQLNGHEFEQTPR